jgi:hypothetical protein
VKFGKIETLALASVAITIMAILWFPGLFVVAAFGGDFEVLLFLAWLTPALATLAFVLGIVSVWKFHRSGQVSEQVALWNLFVSGLFEAFVLYVAVGEALS